MKDIVILSIGHDDYAIQGKPAIAGKLLELLADMSPVRKEYRNGYGEPKTYTLTAKAVEVSVEMIERKNLFPPTPEDLAKDGAIDIKALPGGVKLLGRGRA